MGRELMERTSDTMSREYCVALVASEGQVARFACIRFWKTTPSTGTPTVCPR